MVPAAGCIQLSAAPQAPRRSCKRQWARWPCSAAALPCLWRSAAPPRRAAATAHPEAPPCHHWRVTATHAELLGGTGRPPSLCRAGPSSRRAPGDPLTTEPPGDQAETGTDCCHCCHDDSVHPTARWREERCAVDQAQLASPLAQLVRHVARVRPASIPSSHVAFRPSCHPLSCRCAAPAHPSTSSTRRRGGSLRRVVQRGTAPARAASPCLLAPAAPRLH